MTRRSRSNAGLVARRKVTEYRTGRLDAGSAPQDWDLGASEFDNCPEPGEWGCGRCMDCLAAFVREWSEGAPERAMRDAADAFDAAVKMGEVWPASQALPAAWRPQDRGGSARQAAVLRWVELISSAQPVRIIEQLAGDVDQFMAARRLRRTHRAWEWGYPLRLAVLSYPVWVRPLSSWRGQSPEDLLAHLLVEFKPKPVFWRWLLEDDSPFDGECVHAPEMNPLVWFVCHAQGIGMAAVAAHMGWNLSPAVVRAVESLTLEDVNVFTPAWWYTPPHRIRLGRDLLSLAANVRIGAAVEDVGTAELIAWLRAAGWRCKALPEKDDLVIGTARWLARHRSELAQEHDRLSILRWARHRHDEAARRRWNAETQEYEQLPALPFTWRGRTPRGALAAARAYEWQIAAQCSDALSWPSHGWDWQQPSSDPTQADWRLVELLTSSELAAEGAVQGHCVGSYSERCARGDSAIFQVRRGEEDRRATIEVHPPSKRLIQVRGRFNSHPEPEVAAAVHQWVSAFGLIWNGTF